MAAEKVWTGWRWEWRDDEQRKSLPAREETVRDGDCLGYEIGGRFEPVCRAKGAR